MPSNTKPPRKTVASRFPLLLSVLLLLVGCVNPKPIGKVAFRVIDAETRKPLAGVEVAVQAAESDPTGVMTITGSRSYLYRGARFTASDGVLEFDKVNSDFLFQFYIEAYDRTQASFVGGKLRLEKYVSRWDQKPLGVAEIVDDKFLIPLARRRMDVTIDEIWDLSISQNKECVNWSQHRAFPFLLELADYTKPIKLTLKLPQNHLVSGNFWRVVAYGQRKTVQYILLWPATNLTAEEAYQQARSLMKEWDLPQGNLDEWFEKAKKGERDKAFESARSKGIPFTKFGLYPANMDDKLWYVFLTIYFELPTK